MGKKVKKFLTTNIGYKILAIIFAFVLWLVVVNIQNPAANKVFSNIPVTIINDDRVLDGDHIYDVVSGDTVTVTVYATRSVLAGLNASDFNAEADFASLSITNAAPITVSLKPEKARYSNQIDISKQPTSMVIDVKKLTTAEFPVEIKYVGTELGHATVDEVNISPEVVMVNLPESRIGEIAHVYVEIPYAQIEDGAVFEVRPKVFDENGVEINDEEITIGTDRVAVEYRVYDTKTVPIKIVPEGTPKDGYVLDGVTMSMTEATIKAEPDVLNEITEIEIPGRILSVNNRTDNVNAVVYLNKYLPEGVTLVGEDSKVEITAVIKAITLATTSEN